MLLRTVRNKHLKIESPEVRGILFILGDSNCQHLLDHGKSKRVPEKHLFLLYWQCTALMYSFSYLEPVCCSMSSSNCCFLTCIQISQEAGQVIWYSHLLKNFPQFIVIHTVRDFGIVNKTEIDIFLELLFFQWSNRCWQFDLRFLCLFENQLEHLEVHGSCIAEAWLEEFWALLY